MVHLVYLGTLKKYMWLGTGTWLLGGRPIPSPSLRFSCCTQRELGTYHISCRLEKRREGSTVKYETLPEIDARVGKPSDVAQEPKCAESVRQREHCG